MNIMVLLPTSFSVKMVAFLVQNGLLTVKYLFWWIWCQNFVNIVLPCPSFNWWLEIMLKNFEIVCQLYCYKQCYAFSGRKQVLEKDDMLKSLIQHSWTWFPTYLWKLCLNIWSFTFYFSSPPPTPPFFTWSGLTKLYLLCKIKPTLDHHNITQSMFNFRDICLSSYEP